MQKPRIFVQLIGDAVGREVNHFQLLQQQAALEEGRRLDLDVEVVFAPGFDQLRVLRRRLADATAGTVDAVVTEPASTASLDLILAELRGKTGLVVLSAWGPSIDRAIAGWGGVLPIGGVGTDHVKVGQIQGGQAKALLPAGGRMLYVSGPLRSSAAQQRLDGLKGELGPEIHVEETSGGQWIEADGIIGFNDWYRVAKSRDPIVDVIAAGNDELAIGARMACEALSQAEHRQALLKAKFLGVDACPTYGQRLVAEGKLTASVLTPANTGLALAHLERFYRQGVPVPPRSFTEALPFP